MVSNTSYQRRKEKGLCARCDSKAEKGKALCGICAEKNRENSRKNYQEKKDKGQLYTDEYTDKEWMADE